jgi:hypothetical protein
MRAYLRVMQEHHAFNPDSEQQSDWVFTAYSLKVTFKGN